MLNIKIHKVLFDLSAKKRNRFNKYLQSPYFNVNEDVLLLFDAIIEIYNNNNEVNVKKEDLWSKVSFDTYDDAKFRQLNNKLLSLFEDFLAQEIYQEKKLTKPIFQLEHLKAEPFPVLTNQLLKKSRKLAERYKELSSEYHINLYSIENLYFTLTFDFQRKQRKVPKTEKFNLSKALHHLDVFYIAEKLKFLYIQLFWGAYFEEEDPSLFRNRILNLLDTGNYKDEILLQAFYFAIRTLTSPKKETYYHSLRTIVRTNFNDFNEENKTFFYDSMLTYCVRQVNKGNLKFQDELFSLYQDAIEKEIIIKNERISPITFRNVVLYSLRTANYEWAELFINNYSKYLQESERENAINFNLSRVYFYQKQYGESLYTLNQVNLDDLFYDLNGRTLLLAVYYELGETEPMLSSIDAFNAVLRRKKLSPAAKKRYKNYLKFTKKLAKIGPYNFAKIGQIKEDLKTESMVNKQWIEEKVSELEEGTKKKAFRG